VQQEEHQAAATWRNAGKRPETEGLQVEISVEHPVRQGRIQQYAVVY
jgi:hypothetical protein